MTDWPTKKALTAPEIVEQRFVLNEYMAEVNDSLTLADLLAPATWREASHFCRPGDTIRCVCDSYDLTLVVKSVMPKLGCTMAVYGEDTAPHTPLGKRLDAAERLVLDENRQQMMADLGIKRGPA